MSKPIHFCEILDNWDMLVALTCEKGEVLEYSEMEERLRKRWEAGYREPLAKVVELDEIYIPERPELSTIPF